MNRARRNQGFTLIEVMIALTLMTVGAMGLMAMERHVLMANRHARRVETATQIAENWLERLRMDAMAWPRLTVLDAPGNQAPFNAGARNVAALQFTQWLRQISGAQNVFQTIAINPTPIVGSGPNISNAFDFQGRDVLPGAGVNHAYCASFRLNFTRWEAGEFPRAMRAEVRVWWPRERSGVGPATAPFSTCTDAGADLSPGGANFPNYHFVQLSTVISATN